MIDRDYRWIIRIIASVGAVLVVTRGAWGGWPASPISAEMRSAATVSHFSAGEFTGWQIVESATLGLPVMAIGRPVNAGRTRDGQLAAVLRAAGSNAQFEPLAENAPRNLTRATFREKRDGLPVLSGRADLVLNSRNEIMRWSLRAHDQYATGGTHFLSLHDAAAALAAAIGQPTWQANGERSFACWLPDHERRQLTAAYWIALSGADPHERWFGVVDAESGAILLDWPGICTAIVRGTVRGPYWQPFDHSPVQIAPHRSAQVTINGNIVITDSAGNFAREAGNTANLEARLTGPYVDVQNDAGTNGLITRTMNAPFAPFNWEWTVEDATRAELNLFYHTMFCHTWYKVLDPGFTALDYPLPAVANYGRGYDNAFWNGHGTYYGSGGQYNNFAMYSDIVYHEYTHGVTDGIYPDDMLPYIDQPGALNEAWSDYVSCTINGDPYMAEYIGDVFHSYFRNLDNDLVFPRDWFGEVHYDSRFVSAALWEMRNELGAEITDDLAHFARYALAETFIDYLVAVLETDDNDGDLSNGTPHGAVIYEKFGRHGIGPGDDPQFAIRNLRYYADGTGGSIGNGNRFVEAGETVELAFDLANEAVLFPPPATGISVTVHTSAAGVTISNGTQTFAQLGPGESVALAPALMAMGPAAHNHWVVMEIDVAANGGEATYHYEFEFTVGKPQVLIVQDDPVSHVERYVTRSLRTADRVYDTVELAAGQSLTADLLPDSGLVIWLSGNAVTGILTPQDQTLLRGFLDAGQYVVLSGQNITDELAGTPFVQEVLQVTIASDRVNSYAILAGTEPFAAGDWMMITGAGGAANQNEQSSYTPFGNSRTVANYGRNGDGPAAIVEFSGGRGLLFGFGIEAVSGMDAGSMNVTQLLYMLQVWAGVELASTVPPNERAVELPQVPLLGPAYPNPFNANTTMEFTIPEGPAGRLVIYDVLGRRVHEESLMQATGRVSWQPQGAAGVYFAQLQWATGESPPMKLLYLR